MATGLIFPDLWIGALRGRMTTSHTLNGLGGGYDLCMVNDSAKKSRGCDEGS